MGKVTQKRAGPLGFLLDLIYPPSCPLCGVFMEPLKGYDQGLKASFCRECLERLKPVNPPFCAVCCVPMPQVSGDDTICIACMKKRPIYRVSFAPFLYEGTAAEAIKQLKYDKKTFLAPFMADLMVPFLESRLGIMERPLLMPVPLHPKRLRERGFNQSLLLAKDIARRLSLELDYLSLRRVRYTSPQMALDMKERHENVKMAFGVTDPARCRGRDILLIDDVATTGTTLNECALVLKEAGAREVFCLTFAKAAI